jgi:hypothetical protein
MECYNCGTSLSIQDVERNEWLDDCEIFIIKCSTCSNQTKLESFLFDVDNHLSSQYIKMIFLDSKFETKEKYTNYIPEKQRKMIFDHVSSCSVCSNKIENLRLSELTKEFKFNESAYKFFIERSKDVIKELKQKQIKVNSSEIEGFIFEDKFYDVCSDNLFCRHEEEINNVKIERLGYSLEKENFNIGMVSFIKSNGKIILEKIWLKSEERLKKEKQFLLNLKSCKISILFELIKKLPSFV